VTRLRRRQDKDALLPAVAGAAFTAYWLPALATVFPRLRSPLGIRDRVASCDGVALTFDDGPHPQGTPAVLEALAAAGARATFFLVGEQVERRPALAAQIAAAGHDVALHCYRHRNLLCLSPSQVSDDLVRAVAVIGEATGQTPRLYRPPYGIFTAAALTIAHHHGWEPLLWSRAGHDWARRATPASIAARLTDRLRGGDVLLLHDADYYSAQDSWRRTVSALPLVFEALSRERLAAVMA
jgi:peptidoglycan/xylan/chitin deacetylase (PgdA/CDA1 family)